MSTMELAPPQAQAANPILDREIQARRVGDSQVPGWYATARTLYPESETRSQTEQDAAWAAYHVECDTNPSHRVPKWILDECAATSVIQMGAVSLPSFMIS